MNSTLSTTPGGGGQRPDAAHLLVRGGLAPRELAEIFNSLPYMALVINRERETVFANRALLGMLGFDDLGKVLGRRPGTLLSCLQVLDHAAECGAADECRHCQVTMAVNEGLESGHPVVREARMSARAGNRLIARDLRVTVQPLELAGQSLAMVYLEDTSAEKRREHLESIFLHDLLNSIGSLQLVAEMLHDRLPRAQAADLARQIDWLADEVRAQQLLSQAESGELVRDISCVPARALIDDTLAGIGPWAARRGVEFAVETPAEPAYLASDPLLARRVLLNAVKNAVEASATGECVHLAVLAQGDEIVVTVRNRAVMAEDVQAQLFQRSFTTKGDGRGLGTYGMRLLLENFLEGRVRCSSKAAEGTIFSLYFPSLQSYLARTG